ncbi:MAG: M14 family zinc carboxypeptidase [Oscillospiraceae bacterium]|nr:M14 family zinc carboxypeptidase [Oscillospiraceae bacterium]
MEPSFYSLPPTFPRIQEKMRAYQPFCDGQTAAIFPIGRSLLNRGIYAVRLGNARRFSLFVGGVHGQEWLTSLLLFRFLDDLFSSITQNRPIADIHVKKALDHHGLAVIPAFNPDGISIALEGASGAPGMEQAVTGLCGGDFSSWQANARGIDLNHNFDAGFALCKQAEQDAGILGPGPGRYGGEEPESEPETRALCRFIRTQPVRQLYAFHSQGEEIYFRYGEHTPPRSQLIAQVLASASGYALADPTGTASHGGLKDWFIDAFHRPGFTVEIGRGKNPLPITELEPIYARLIEMLLAAMIL